MMMVLGLFVFQLRTDQLRQAMSSIGYEVAVDRGDAPGHSRTEGSEL